MTPVGFSSRELALLKRHDICRIATITQDGWPHCVPVGYLYRNGQFYIPVSKSSKKVSNLRANHCACIVIDDEKENVLMVQGYVEIIEDKRFTKLKRWMTAKTAWTISKPSLGAILVLRPEKKASRKLT
jgi:nitroimidazol reductase NimA-like FMN-containing flavoprotein (pyridoxamine 5'-phosphate oxidase superfamily)